MANSSIGGLVSGLDTATIISQLMQLEARPQLLLKSKVSTEQKVVTALQGINSKLATLLTKASDLAKGSAWSPTKATSSNENVTVTADAGATTAAISFQVTSTAKAYSALYATPLTSDAEATTASSLAVTYADGRESATVTLTDRSLRGVADAINNHATAGLQATLVRTGGADDQPEYQLQVTSKSTGELSGFTLTDGTTGFLGGVDGQVAGADARLTIGGVVRRYASNTITDLMPGVDVTLQAAATGTATVAVERDVQSLSDSVKAMVDAVNGALDDITMHSAYNAPGKAGGVLAGDSIARDVRFQLLDAVTGGVGGKSLSTVGIQVDRYGKLSFDEAKFISAHTADPVGTQAMIAGTHATDGTSLTDGLADRFAALGKAFSNSTDGIVTMSIKSRQSSITGLQNDIADWDVRLETRRTTLQRQYTALESALGKLQSQSTWLAGQIASLPQMSSGQ